MWRCKYQTPLEVGIKTKLNARLAIRQRADLFEANDSATKLAFLRARATLKERSDSLL